MKANELKVTDIMVGDWVRVISAEPNTYRRPFYQIITVEKMMMIRNRRMVVEPIPLTPEILEKNGFEREPFVTHCDMYSGIDRRVNMHNSKEYANSNNEWHVHIDSEDYCSIASCELTYVHELQQILRLCKIDKEIIV